MNQAYLGRGEERRLLRLGRPLGEGASGKVYALDGRPGHAAKLYHDAEEARRYEAKIDAMLTKPPELPPAEHGGAIYPQIAWPTAKLHDRAGCFIGFLMPEVDFARSTSLVNLLQKNSRKLEGISDYYGYRVLVARNLASVFAELHRAGHHMIDLKPANLRFYPAVSWMAVVDADGFSIAGSNGRIGALQLSDEYIAPESWKRKPGELGLGQDLFALAAIIFQLLNNGVHPFAGTVSGSAGTDLQTRIVQGHYPYAAAPKPGLTPSTASIHRMFRRATRAMFDAAFLSAQRPSAADWRNHLDQLVAQLTPCAARPAEHVHFGAGCGFCGHEARVDGVRAAPRRPVAPRRAATAQLPTRVVLPLQHVVARGAPMRRRRQPAMAGFVLSSSIAAALFAGFAIASDQIWEQWLLRRASAATLEIPAPSFGGRVTPLDAPLDYLILPPPGAERLAVREGPGEGYAMIGELDASQELLGTGSGMASDGTRWMLVTLADGVSGFVPERSLIERGAVVRPLACPAGKVCLDGAVVATEAMLGSRYRELLGRSNPERRRTLEAGQRVWESARRACNDVAVPASCRVEAGVARLSALDDLAIGGGG